MHPRSSVSAPQQQRANPRRIRRWMSRGFLPLVCICVVVSLPVQMLPAAAAGQTARLTAPTLDQVAPLTRVPVAFEENKGQAPGQVAFLANDGPSTVLMERDRLVLSVARTADQSRSALQQRSVASPSQRRPEVVARGEVSMSFVGANPSPAIVGIAEQPGKVNYFIGNDPSRWQTDVPTFARIEYKDLYPGIDLLFYGTAGGQIEHDWIVHPGADATHIHLRLGGQSSVELSRGGDLTLDTPAGSLTQTRPVAYELGMDGAHHPVAAGYQLSRAGDITFGVQRRDNRATLVIDPAFQFSTYLGGTVSWTSAGGVAVDSQGDTYLFGYRLPTGGGGQNPVGVSVMKIDPTDSTILYSTVFGGDYGTNPNWDYPAGLAIDPAGSAYVVGGTAACNFPTVNQIPGAAPPSCSTPYRGYPTTSISAGFITKLSPSGSSIVYSSIVGGSTSGSSFSGVAVDSSGNAYVSGSTFAADYPTTAGAYQRTFTATTNNSMVVVSEVTAAGSAFQFSTLLGGSPGPDFGRGIAIDTTGGVYVTGSAWDKNFPTTSGSVQPTSTGTREEPFVSKLTGTGSTLAYSTYVGGTGGDDAYAIAVDASGGAIIAGAAGSTDFPTHNAFQSALAGDADGFVTKLNATGSAFVYSTYLGGQWQDWASAVAVDANGDAFVVGHVDSPNFPTVNPLEKSPGDESSYSDGFASEFNPSGVPQYITYLGGAKNDDAFGVTVDTTGDAYVVGVTSSDDFPIVAALQPVTEGGAGFLTKIQTVGDIAKPLGGVPTDKEFGNVCLACLARLEQDLAQLFGDPVNAENGSLTESVTDLTIPARGKPLTFARTYDSVLAGTSGVLGYGWSFNAGASLSQDPTTGAVTINQENGSQVVFTKTGSTFTPAAPRTLATLVQNADGTFTLTRQAREQLRFSTVGKIVSAADLNGNTTSYAYNGSGQLSAITEPAGRALTLAYTGSVLTSVTDPIGRVVHFGYNDGAGNLTDVTDVNGGGTHYTYDASHRLLTITDPRGATSTNVYDAGGRVTSQTATVAPNQPSANRTTTFAYVGDPRSAAGSTTTITDPKGNVTVEHYAFSLSASVTRGYGTPQAATTARTYDPRTLELASVTDPNGNMTRKAYDADGNTVAITDPLGRTSVATYDSLNDMTSTTDPTGVTTTMSYDGAGNLHSRSTPSGAGSVVTTYTYSSTSHPGDITAMTNPDGKTWSYTYDTDGDLASVADPLGDTTSYSYNDIGWKTAAVSARGNVVGCNCASQYTTSYSYTDPQTGALDGFGDVRVTTDPLGHQSVTVYDADRNLVSTTDSNGNVTQYTYDLANEPTAVLRADGTSLRTDYNPDGTMADQIDGAGNKTSYAYDPLRRVTSVTDPLNRATSFTYDAAGNHLTTTDPQNQTTTDSYDAANELTSITYSDNRTPNVTEVTYDADGRRTGMTDGTGTSSFDYDPLGRLTFSSDGNDAFVQYTYDLAGHLTSLSYPNGQTIHRGYDDAGRMTSVTDWLGHTTTFTPDPESEITTEALPNNVTASFSYDHAGQLTSITDQLNTGSTLANFGYTRDADGQLTTDTAAGGITGSNSYGYTALNQLGNLNGQAYSYDAADNPVLLATGPTQAFDAANQLSAAGPGISLVGTTSGGDGGAAAVLTVPLPAGVSSGDQIIVASTQSATNTAFTPAGYMQVGTATSGGTNAGETVVWRKTATAGDTTVVVPYAGQFAKAVIVAVYRGVDPVNPVDGQSSGGTAAGTSLALPSVTATVPGDRLVVEDGALGSFSAATWSPPTGMTTRATQSTLPAVSASIADQIDPYKGATGTRTAGFGQSGQLSGLLVALRPASMTTFSYDARGDRIASAGLSGAGTAMTYDQDGRLTQFVPAGGMSFGYSYDADGLRASKAQAANSTVAALTTHFAWDRSAGLPVLLTDGQNSYIYGPTGPIEQISSTGAVAYYLGDQIGSTRLLTDQSGGVVATFTYDPYGSLIASTGSTTTPLLYAGQYRDAESGLYYMHARYYDPATAQFLTRDPLTSLTKQPYSYVNNNPLNGKDPTGLDAWGCDEQGVQCTGSQSPPVSPEDPPTPTLTCAGTAGDPENLGGNCQDIASCTSIDACRSAIDEYMHLLNEYADLAYKTAPCRDNVPPVYQEALQELRTLHSYVDLVNVKGNQLAAAASAENQWNCKKAWWGATGYASLATAGAGAIAQIGVRAAVGTAAGTFGLGFGAETC